MVNLEDYRLRLLGSIAHINPTNSQRVILLNNDPDLMERNFTVRRTLILSYTPPLCKDKTIWFDCDPASATFGKFFRYTPNAEEVTTYSELFDNFL